MSPRKYLASIVIVGMLGVAALSAPWLESRRPLSPEMQADQTIDVVAAGDRGPGTLREAIFAAAQAGRRVRIVVHPRRIALRTPLPPVLGSEGIVIDALASRCELDGSAVSAGPLLEIMSPSTTVAGLRFRNAREEGIVVRASNVLMRRLAFTGCGDGVSVAGTTEQTSIEDSRFVDNTTGIRISPGARAVTITRNEFQRHQEAAIWASAAAPETDRTPITIGRNRFEADRISILLINFVGLVQSNEIRASLEIGIYVLGSRTVARHNSIHGGGTGILVDASQNALIEQNQIDRTQVAVLVRNSRSLSISRNRVYSNAFGLAVIFGDPSAPVILSENLVLANSLDGVYVVGASPFIRANQVIQNGAAGARFLTYVPWDGPRVPAAPRLEANTFRQNRFNEAVTGEFRPQREEPK